ncbi:MAG: VTT domain-containing protein [Thermodesulfobacteriota bacterium]
MRSRFLTKPVIAFIVILCGLILWGAYLYRDLIRDNAWLFYHFLADREKIREFILNAGPLAPAFFIAIQFLQVLLAPVPGEATGFIGGYLFGVIQSFVYSSLALSAGSWVNFIIGRFFGKRYIRKLIPKKQMEWLDTFVRRQGIFVLFIFFIFPGFPKDSLCLFLGLTKIPFKAFMIIASFGRMPGTLMLSIQGAFLYEKMYGPLIVVASFCIGLSLVMYRFRTGIYRWMDRFNNNRSD